MSDEPRPSYLVVDDDEVLRRQLVRALDSRGFDVRSAASFEEAVSLAEAEPPEYAVVDLRLAQRSGLDLVRVLLDLDAGTRVVMLTGYGSIATAVEATKLGAVNYLSKPADVDEIIAAFEPEASTEGAAVVRAPSLARAEWEHINRVLADCGGNVSEAARRLKIHRRSLQRKLSKRAPG